MSKPQANRTSPSPQVWILRRRYIGPTRTKKMSGGKSGLKKDINHVSTLQNRAFELFPLCPFALPYTGTLRVWYSGPINASLAPTEDQIRRGEVNEGTMPVSWHEHEEEG
ncbi:hypothetical protein N7445_006405 [Penicillium cf. griseofulvum]|nr:hypothetical protein N7445_006405 [Penicillium cf. griseofulvum]